MPIVIFVLNTCTIVQKLDWSIWRIISMVEMDVKFPIIRKADNEIQLDKTSFTSAGSAWF